MRIKWYLFDHVNRDFAVCLWDNFILINKALESFDNICLLIFPVQIVEYIGYKEACQLDVSVERLPRPRTSTVRSIDLAQVVQNDTIVYNCPSCYYDSGQSLCWSAVYLQSCSSLVSSWPYCGKGKEVPFHLRVRALFLGTLCSSAALPLLFFSAFNKFAVQCRRL